MYAFETLIASCILAQVSAQKYQTKMLGAIQVFCRRKHAQVMEVLKKQNLQKILSILNGFYEGLVLKPLPSSGANNRWQLQKFTTTRAETSLIKPRQYHSETVHNGREVGFS